MKNLLSLFIILFSLSLFAQTNGSQGRHYCQHWKADQHQNASSDFREASADNSRSDTIDIINYKIDLEVVNMPTDSIKGSCLIDFNVLIETDHINLDLQTLDPWQIFWDGINVDFTYESPNLRVNFPANVLPGENHQVQVFYEGEPQNSTWGGFYMNNQEAFNIGVGIGVDPPNYGRAWFPCFDNFVERSTYQYNITTDPDFKAFCGGLLVDISDNEDGTMTWFWELSQEIPTYLSSMAVGQYTAYEFIHEGMNNDIPVMIAGNASDQPKLEEAFIHLPDAIDCYESSFGPYLWDRVGYSIVAFNGGAMEHACNIAYPRFAINSPTTYESLMAHELSHHWWGDLVTCETASDMWINEGWASYCERLFFESVYGQQRYKDEIRSNHASVLLYNTINEGGNYPISPIPFDYTYGGTIYNKGADMVHNLRGYMQDSLFFNCTTAFLDEFKFQAVNSYTFSDFLSNCSGMDMSHYFDDWIFETGYNHFSIDSVFTVDQDSLGIGTFRVAVRQRLQERENYSDNAPIDLTFFDSEMNQTTRRVFASGGGSLFPFDLDFEPVHVSLDLEEKISDATIDEYKWISETGNYTFSNTVSSLTVNEISDSVMVRVVYNAVMPDRMETPILDLVLAEQHYWKVEILEGGPDASLDASLRLNYNGKVTTAGGYWDTDLFSIPEEDSLYLLYRPGPGNDWQIVEDVLFNPQNILFDRVGYFNVNQVQAGEYAFAMNDVDRTDTLETVQVDYQLIYSLDTMVVDTMVVDTMNMDTTGMSLFEIEAEQLKLFPNPTSGFVTFSLPLNTKIEYLEVINSAGEILLIKKNLNANNLDLSHLKEGLYFVKLVTDSGDKIERKIIIAR